MVVVMLYGDVVEVSVVYGTCPAGCSSPWNEGERLLREEERRRRGFQGDPCEVTRATVEMAGTILD